MPTALNWSEIGKQIALLSQAHLIDWKSRTSTWWNSVTLVQTLFSIIGVFLILCLFLVYRLYKKVPKEEITVTYFKNRKRPNKKQRRKAAKEAKRNVANRSLALTPLQQPVSCVRTHESGRTLSRSRSFSPTPHVIANIIGVPRTISHPGLCLACKNISRCLHVKCYQKYPSCRACINKSCHHYSEKLSACRFGNANKRTLEKESSVCHGKFQRTSHKNRKRL